MATAQEQQDQASKDRAASTNVDPKTNLTPKRLQDYPTLDVWQQGMPTDVRVAAGQQAGRAAAERLYGMGGEDIRGETMDITRRRREALEGKDPASTRLRESKNQQIRAAKAGGASASQMAQIERQAASDIGQSEFRTQDKALSDYQKLIGNILGGTSSLETGYAALEKAGETVQVPTQSGGGLGTIICTELHAQGYMTGEMLEKDKEHGRFIRSNDHNVYIGYIWLASPIVKLMRKSSIFTDLISIPAMEWAKDMAKEKSFFGKLINKIGTPICRAVGSVIVYLNKMELVYA